MPDSSVTPSNDKTSKPAFSEAAQQASSMGAGMASAAGDKAQEIVSGLADEFENMFEERKAEGAQQMHRFANAMARAGGELGDEFPLVARAVERGASELDKLAVTLEERNGRTLASEAGDLARRRTGAVAGLMGLVGFAAVRFLMARPLRPDDHTRSRGDGDRRGTNKDVQEDRVSSTEAGPAKALGDPGGASPEAPRFETGSETGGASRGQS